MNILSRNPLSTTIAALSLSATILGIHANQATASLGGNATPPPTTIANSADGLCATPYTIKKVTPYRSLQNATAVIYLTMSILFGSQTM